MNNHYFEFCELLRRFADRSKWFSREQLETAVEAHPLDGIGPGVSHGTGLAVAATSGFVFKCRTCEESGMDNPWYQIVRPITEFGGLFVDLWIGSGLDWIGVIMYLCYVYALFALLEVYRFGKPKLK